MGDRVPMWGQWLYWVVLIVASVLGPVMEVRDKRPLLGILSVLALFAWRITLAVELSSGRFTTPANTHWHVRGTRLSVSQGRHRCGLGHLNGVNAEAGGRVVRTLGRHEVHVFAKA